MGGFARDRVTEFLAPELDPDAAPPESVVRIPPGRLIGSILLSGVTIFLVVAAIAAFVSGALTDSGWLPLAVLPALIGIVGYYLSRLNRSLRFSIAGTPDGVRVGFGLLSTSNETLPPGRIHAIGISQPLLWRPFGWWQVRINKAGRSSAQGAAGEASTTVLPVGTDADVARVLELILPGYNAEEQRALIDRGMRSRGGSDGFVNAPRRAAWLRPFSWRRTGYTVSAGAARPAPRDDLPRTHPRAAGQGAERAHQPGPDPASARSRRGAAAHRGGPGDRNARGRRRRRGRAPVRGGRGRGGHLRHHRHQSPLEPPDGSP